MFAVAKHISNKMVIQKLIRAKWSYKNLYKNIFVQKGFIN